MSEPTPRPTFPIQSERGAKPHPLQIPWDVAELAYSVYSGEYGRSQSLRRLAERGGFGPGEMDMYLPDWRDRCDRIKQLEAQHDELVAALKLARWWLANSVPTADLDGPKPLPVIEAVLARTREE